MKKHSFLAIILALAMVLCCAVGVCATDNATEYNKEYNVTYTIDNGTTAAINVLVTIEGNGLDFVSIPVTLTQSTKSHKVVDALLSSAVSTAGYGFYLNRTDSNGDPVTDDDGNPIYDATTTSSTYFSHIKYDDTYYGGTGSGYNGWCFRINGGIPQEMSPYDYLWGSTINTAVIHNGDVIAVHIDDPISESATTRFMRASVTSHTATSVTANVTESHQYYGENYVWNPLAFAPLTNKSFTAKIYDEATTLSVENCWGTAYLSSNGTVTFTGLDLDPGTYYLVVSGDMSTSASPRYSSCITSFTVK